MAPQSGEPRERDKPARLIIIEALKQAGGRPLTVSELVQITKLNRNTIRGRLQDLKREGIVEHVEGGWILKSEKNSSS